MGVPLCVFLAMMVGFLIGVRSANNNVSGTNGANALEAVGDQINCKNGVWDVVEKACKCKPEWGYHHENKDCRECKCGKSTNCTFTKGSLWIFAYGKKCICKEGFAQKNYKCVDTCESKCGLPSGVKENDDVKCNVEGESITCSCVKNPAQSFDYTEKTCIDTCESKCGLPSGVKENDDVKCNVLVEGESITCSCVKNPAQSFDYTEKTCIETCESKCGFGKGETENDVAICEQDSTRITCTCKISDLAFDYYHKQCVETCDGKCGFAKGQTESEDVKCVRKGSKKITCKCKKDSALAFDYVQKQCVETCEGKCGLSEGRTENDEVVCRKYLTSVICACKNSELIFDYNQKHCIVEDVTCDNRFKDCRSTGGTCLMTDEGLICKCPNETKFHYEYRKCLVEDKTCERRVPGCQEIGGKCISTSTGIKCQCPDETVFDSTRQKCLVSDVRCLTEMPKCISSDGHCSIDYGKIYCVCPSKRMYDLEKGCTGIEELCDKLMPMCRRTHGNCSRETGPMECICPRGGTYDYKKGCPEICHNDTDCPYGEKCSKDLCMCPELFYVSKNCDFVHEKKCQLVLPGCRESRGTCLYDVKKNIFCDCYKKAWDEEKRICVDTDEICDKVKPRCKETHGRCSTEFGTLECICPFGGVYDEENGCKDCKCENGNCVTDNQGNTKCACRVGYALQEEFTCKPCDCGSLGKCFFILNLTYSDHFEYQKKCVCDAGSAEKDGVCVGCFCGDNSTCNFDYGVKRCYCIEGYSEKNGVCTIIDDDKDDILIFNKSLCDMVKPMCKITKGHCVTTSNGVLECVCPGNTTYGFGEGCRDCDCGVHGKCDIQNGKKTCFCAHGFIDVGGKCEDPCSENPCKNGARCITQDESYSCICKKPYFGKNCEKDPCSEKPCRNNGICLVDGDSFKCFCRSPYSGNACENDPCTNHYCYNGGTCIIEKYASRCACLASYSGEACEINTEYMKITLWGLCLIAVILILIIGFTQCSKRNEKKHYDYTKNA